MNRTYGRWRVELETTHWQSVGVSVAATTTLFAVALVSMMKLSPVVGAFRSVSEPPKLVALLPPAPRPLAPTPAIVRPRVSTVLRHPGAPALPTPADRAVEAVPESATVARDSTAHPVSGAMVPGARPLSVAPVIRGAAPLTPAAVTPRVVSKYDGNPRDSMFVPELPSIIEAARLLPPNDSEKAEYQRTHQPNRPIPGGGSQGTVGTGVSVPFPLFSSGPSRAQRKRDSIVNADYQLRLRRLQDLVIRRRDLTRLDSLRRDSVARAKRPFD